MTGFSVFLVNAFVFLLPAVHAAAEDIKMQLDGQAWTASVVNVSVIAGPKKTIIIAGKMEGPKISLLSFQFAPSAPDAPKGHYELKPGLPAGASGNGMFNPDLLGGNPMEDSFKFQSGTLDITDYDPATHSLSGTFSGQLVNHSGSKKATATAGILDKIEMTP